MQRQAKLTPHAHNSAVWKMFAELFLDSEVPQQADVRKEDYNSVILSLPLILTSSNFRCAASSADLQSAWSEPVLFINRIVLIIAFMQILNAKKVGFFPPLGLGLGLVLWTPSTD